LTFQVVWGQRAVNDLAEIWLQGDSTLRQAVTQATHTIAHGLRDDPFETSKSREGEDRVTFASCLGVLFAVDLDLRIVRVEHVWRYQTPKRRA
jgi:hypothetical protein